MTWVAYDGDEPIVGSESDDPGMCMLFLMRYVPEEIGWDYVKWLDMRNERAETAVRALFDPATAAGLKEEYISFMSTIATEVGFCNILYSNLSIRTDENMEEDHKITYSDMLTCDGGIEESKEVNKDGQT